MILNDNALERILETRTRLHEEIAALASTAPGADALGRLVHQLARLEGQHRAVHAALSVRREGGSNDAVLRVLLDLLRNGADDTWSGRLNDIARSRFDGLRDAVNDLITHNYLR